MRIAAMLLASFAIVFSGIGVIVATFPYSAARRGRATAIFLGISAGIGLWSVTYLFLVVSHTVTPGAMIAKDIALAVVGLALLGTRRRVRDDSEPQHVTRAGNGPLIVLIVIMVIIALAGFIAQSARHPNGDWDAWAIWNTRARFFIRTEDLRLTFHPELPHADYPALLPATVAQCWALSGGESPVVPALVAGIFSVLCVGLLMSAIAWLRDTRTALFVGIILLGTPEFTRQAANQYADVPISLYLLGCCVLISAAARVTMMRTRVFLACGILASLMMWTKNEGTLYALCLAALLLVVTEGEPAAKRLRNTIAFAAGAVPLFIFLCWFRHKLVPANDLILASSTQGAISRLRDPARYAHVIGALLWRIILFNRWNIFLAGVSLIWLIRALRGSLAPGVARLVAALLLMLAGLGMVYLLTPFNLDWHISSSMSRLIVQLWPSALFATSLMLPMEGEPGFLIWRTSSVS